MLDWIIQEGLKRYQKENTGKQLPLNERVFLDTFVNKNLGPITEKDLTLEEIDYLRGNYYDRFQKYNAPLSRYRVYLIRKLEEDKKQKNKNKKLDRMFKAQFEKDLRLIDSYFKNGEISSDFINMLRKPSYETMQGEKEAREGQFKSMFSGVPSNKQTYLDYPKSTRDFSISAGKTVPGAIKHTLGRFSYENRPASIGVVDRYNFNKSFGNPVLSEWGKEGGTVNPYLLLREWAERQLPDEGPNSGREVNIDLPFVNPNTYYGGE